MRNPLSLPSLLDSATLDDFRAAATRIAGDAIKSPLLRFPGPDDREVRLKCENLQPWGSFKIRAGANALAGLDAEMLQAGVATASAGNFAQGLAVAANRRGIPVTVHIPDSAAGAKVAAIERLGATIVRHSFDDWWRIITTRDTGAVDGHFIHPVCEAEVVVGNGGIALEIAEQWPQVDTIVIPFGGGGLASGIALAFRAMGRKVRIIACEVETSTPLASAFAAGMPVTVERRPSFVDGIGSTGVLAEMWPLLAELVDEVVVVSVSEVEAAIRSLIAANALVAEGAGATALAAALSPACSGRHVAAIISGGNIDLGQLARIAGN